MKNIFECLTKCKDRKSEISILKIRIKNLKQENTILREYIACTLLDAKANVIAMQNFISSKGV